jgi:hypothetical protein
MLSPLHIIKDFLNDQLTRQNKVLILRADAGLISDTLFDHSHIIR